jgi:hypothetical protein
MGPLQLIISGLLTLIVYGLALFAVYRIFQISNDVSEIKELLRGIKRNTEDGAAPVPAVPQVAVPQAQSAEALVRAVHENWQVNEKP